MAKLRIAMLAPISWRVPPRHYGAYEQVAGTLTEGLVHRGVDVTLFATGDSQTAGVNQNQGAESTLSWLMALHRVHKILHEKHSPI